VNKRFVIGLAAGLMLLLPACSMFQNVDQSKLIVQIATMKVIEAQGPAHYQERAVNIIKIGNEAKTWLDTNGVSLAFLRAAIEARIAKLNLAPSDQLLAGVLVDAAIAELQKKVGDGVIDPQKLYYVNQVLDWAIGAAKFYTG
jgi:hypothetical protein